jgi:hypothetical protein
MNCIICQDIDLEPLKDNKLCLCKYKYHSSCWSNYVNSKNNDISCPMCRKNISINIINPINIIRNIPEQNVTPYSSQNIQETSNLELNIQTIRNNNSLTFKITHIIIGLCILSLIIAVFIILIKFNK